MRFLVDNSIISSLAKIGRLKLLEEFGSVSTTDAVIHEAFNSHMDAIIESVKKALSDWLKVEKPISKAEVHDYRQTHPSLSYADSELVLIAEGKRFALFTDDRTLAHFVHDETDIQVFDLPAMLFALKNSKVLSHEELKDVVTDLEKKDFHRFTDEVKSCLLS